MPEAADDSVLLPALQSPMVSVLACGPRGAHAVHPAPPLIDVANDVLASVLFADFPCIPPAPSCLENDIFFQYDTKVCACPEGLARVAFIFTDKEAPRGCQSFQKLPNLINIIQQLFYL